MRNPECNSGGRTKKEVMIMTKNKGQLVDQYLENMSRTTLEKYQEVIKKYAGSRHGIYALYRKNKLYYVGLASNLRRRLKHHLRDRHAKSWDSFSIYLTTQDRHLRELETLVLRIIDRKGNRQRGKFGNAEDLRSKVRNDLKKILSIELEDMFCKDASLRLPKKKSKVSKIQKKNNRTPTLAPFIEKAFRIRFKYKEKLYIAKVKKNGSISFAKQSAEFNRLKRNVYTSPSLAARAITGRGVEWVQLRAKNGYSRFEKVLSTLKIPHKKIEEPFDVKLNKVLANIFREA
jgi:hypothetical protein